MAKARMLLKSSDIKANYYSSLLIKKTFLKTTDILEI
jgi:hypothetical protein